jgi:serine/threonine protein kinase
MGLTQTGEMFGSPQYMSPEQCKGVAIDARTDIYSLACVLHEMVMGRPPADADNTIEILMQHVNGLKLDYSATKLPAWLQACLRHALKKDRDRRYISMGDFAESLRNHADKKQPTTGSAADKAFVYDPVVQTGVPKTDTAREKETVLVVTGVGIGVVIICMFLLWVWVFYHP